MSFDNAGVADEILRENVPNELLAPYVRQQFQCAVDRFQSLRNGSTAHGAGVPNRQVSPASGDVCFIACRKSSAHKLRFDDATFDAFHLYDIDFCLRAKACGLPVEVAPGVTISQLSSASVDEACHEQAQRFLLKPRLTTSPIAVSTWVSVQAGTRADASLVASKFSAFDSCGFSVAAGGATSRWIRGSSARVSIVG